MLKWVIDIDLFTYYLSYLIIFIFPSVISAVTFNEYSFNSSIRSIIVNYKTRIYDDSNDINDFLQKRLTSLSDNTDKYLTDIYVSSYESFDILSPPPTYSSPEPPPPISVPLTIFPSIRNPSPTLNSNSFKSPPFPLPTSFPLSSHNRYCRPNKKNSTRGEPRYNPEDKKHHKSLYDHTDHNHFPGCGNYIPGMKPFLSDLLLQNILDKYQNLCNTTILTSGFISLSNSYTNFTALFNDSDNNQLFPHERKILLTSPSLLIQCSNDTLNERPYHAFNNNFTMFLVEVAHNYTNEYLIDDSTSMVYKDKFSNSVLIIIFSQTALCIAAWMMYLILLLLPANNYNSRNIFVHIYVLFYAITQSVFLAMAYNGIIKWEYEHCIQDSYKYEKHIVDLTSFKLCELILNVLCNINWAYIIIFMYNVDSLKHMIGRNRSLSTSSYNLRSLLEKRHTEFLPEFKNIFLNKFNEWIYNPKNRQLFYIIITCIILSAINNTFFVILLWDKTRTDFRAIYKTSELLIYTLLIWNIGLFILRNFGMAITSTGHIDSLNLDNSSMTPSTINNNAFVKNQMQVDNLEDKLRYFKRWVSNIWKNYFNTVPLLIYNILIFIIAYILVIYLTSISAYKYRWKYNLVYFTKLLITVNFWGLIGVLNRREIYLSKKTILGRRIDNQDKFFVAPCSSTNSTSLSVQLSNNFSYCKSDNATTTTTNSATHTGDISNKKNGNIGVQQFLNNNKIKEKKNFFHNIIYKYTVSKPAKSLKPKFNRMKERRIHFAMEKREKKKENYSNTTVSTVNYDPSDMVTKNMDIETISVKNMHHIIHNIESQNSNGSYTS